MEYGNNRLSKENEYIYMLWTLCSTVRKKIVCRTLL